MATAKVYTNLFGTIMIRQDGIVERRRVRRTEGGIGSVDFLLGSQHVITIMRVSGSRTQDLMDF